MSSTRSGPAALRFKSPTERGLFEHAYDVTVVTPVFGGGVRIDSERPQCKPVDAITPLRGTAIRGQLRFWWRATLGCQLASVAEMYDRERVVWGGTREDRDTERDTGRRHVDLQVEASSQLKTTLVPVYKIQDDKIRVVPGMEALAYAAFPLQPAQKSKDRTPGQLTRIDGVFRVTVRGPVEVESEVQDAIAAWIRLGGIGGRTRRGFGSLTCSTVPDATSFLQKWSERATGTLSLVPSLVGVTHRTGAARANAFAAAIAAVERLQQFRQGPEVGRDRKDSGFGRSRWPEPDAIRLITKRNSRGHEPRQRSGKFPRGAFGAPIIFHFKDERSGDPETSTLTPSGEERMASPLILKPLETGKQFVPAAIRLSVPEALDKRFVLSTGRDEHTVDVRLESPSETRVQQLRSTDVLESFLEYFAPR